MNTVYQVKHWLKAHPSPTVQYCVQQIKSAMQSDLPVPITPFKLIDPLAIFAANLWQGMLRHLWYTPRFKARLKNPPKRLYLYSGIPWMNQALDIEVGERCRISGVTTFTGRAHGAQKAQLLIGNNVGISWQTTIAVGTRVVLKDNVRMAGRCFLAGYPGHPVNPAARAAGEPDTDAQVGDIVLEQDVWLGTGCTVLAGVTIGRASIIGAGSVVTKDIPAGVIAAGSPAKVIRPLTEAELRGQSL